MDKFDSYGIRAGLISLFVMIAGIIVVIAGFLYLREQFAWFIILYTVICLLSFLLAGLLAGIFSSGHVGKAVESLKTGLAAGMVTAAIPAALFCILIVFALFAGREQFAWVLLGIRLLATLVFMVAISALISAAYVFVARKGSITIKYNE